MKIGGCRMPEVEFDCGFQYGTKRCCSRWRSLDLSRLINTSQCVSQNRDCPCSPVHDATEYSSGGELEIKRFLFQLRAFCETYAADTAPLRFRIIAIPLLEFHSNDQRPHSTIIFFGQYFFRRSRVSRMKVSSAAV